MIQVNLLRGDAQHEPINVAQAQWPPEWLECVVGPERVAALKKLYQYEDQRSESQLQSLLNDPIQYWD